MRLVLAALLIAGLAAPVAAQRDTTEVVVLGVAHSAMLVSEAQQPAVLRAYFERVAPDALCIERAPEEFARGSHYEFTYEIQHIAVPWARERGVELCPFDWLPDAEDQILAFGVDLSEPPFLRDAGTWQNFLTYDDGADLRRELFWAESDEAREEYRPWYMNMHETPRYDFPRRMFLYRTFLQSMRIARAARESPGGRVLVVVGAMHKDDIERILADQPGVRVVSASSFGAPEPGEVARHVRLDDLFAIATFNLLGLQGATGNVNLRWLSEVLERLERERPGPEVELLRVRYDVLTGALDADAAAARYRDIAARAEAAGARFTWTGVIDRRRVDSFFDPFGNLTVAQRAALEEARELRRAGRSADADARLDRLEQSLDAMKAAQLRGYGEVWLESDRP